MTINDNQNQSRRSISKEILLNYITYASDGTNEINVNDLLEFIDARSIVIANENDKNIKISLGEFGKVLKLVNVSA